MANRRKFLAGLGALASGSAAAMGTGALTIVEADRQVTVNTAGDANAYLGITGDGEYITNDSARGELTIDLGSGNGLSGDGFNKDAVTYVEDIITLRNQGPRGSTGSDPIRISMESDENKFDYDTTVTLADAEVTFMLPTDGEKPAKGKPEATAKRLFPGNEIKLDAEVDTTAGSGEDQSGELTIYANDT